MTDTAAVLAALDAVRDPELDEPVTSLGFVASCTVSADGTVGRAPAAADLLLRARTSPSSWWPTRYDAVSAARRACATTEIVLDDHFASDAINGGRRGPGRLRRVLRRRWRRPSWTTCARDFLRKAVLAGTDRVCRPLLAAGRTADGARRHDARRGPGLARPGAAAGAPGRARAARPTTASPLLVDAVHRRGVGAGRAAAAPAARPG